MNKNNDTIYRQAAIDALDVGAELLRRVLDDADIVGAERGTFKWELELIEACISDMKELPSAQQWIPVTERLPDKECFVLVTVNDGAIYTDLSLFRHDGRFIEHTGDVIAWMPLPEPWDGEDNGQTD